MKKTVVFNIRMSSRDYKIIAKKAELCDMNVSEYLRQAGTGKQVKGFKMSDLDIPETQCKGQLELADLL